ncbi:thioredoxin-disulfide reductase [Candidatus Schneideria nysicola]|uniref:thioredoxin-disulfide reductase n=1 Tax=Candidatus Schneideria nysicola TaxID=1081631 RepID=UPI001CAA747C|nr:thioredoxin-disulfide reductase [Candidatus Schneideria nysicola]UAJ66280.1 thioredoxin-disulfide reductase [Candidatus Schneideria nysicola]
MTKLMIKKNDDLIILGSGPAGYTATLYAARANLNPILITGKNLGGQLMSTDIIENWPGVVESLTGPSLMEKMHAHIKKFQIPIISDHISKVNLDNKPFHLTGYNTEYFCNALIIATGASPRCLDIPSEKKFKGKGISFCATCDGFFYRNKIIAVVGGGNTAIEETLYLSNIAKKIHLIHRRHIFRAEKILVDRLMKKVKSNNIILHMNSIIEEIIGNDNGITNIRLKEKDITTKIISVSGLFIAIGYLPNTEIFAKKLHLENGYIQIHSGLDQSKTATSIKGVFAAGDVMDNRYRQAITAAASGCMAALDAERYLESIK